MAELATGGVSVAPFSSALGPANRSMLLSLVSELVPLISHLPVWGRKMAFSTPKFSTKTFTTAGAESKPP